MDTSESKPGYRNWGSLATAVVVIIIGILFLLDNLGYRPTFMAYQNWWALFILVGAAGPLGYAVQRYRRHGGMDSAVLSSLISAASIIFVALIFLLNLPWNLWWPVFIIFGGLWMLTGNWRRQSGSDPH